MNTRAEKTGSSELTEVFSFRTTLADASKWNSKIARSGYKKSEFFRMAVQQNQTQILAVSPHSARAVFLLSKASNNLNQITHRAHLAHLDGTITAKSFQSILEQLQILNNFMQEQVKESSK